MQFWDFVTKDKDGYEVVTHGSDLKPFCRLVSTVDREWIILKRQFRHPPAVKHLRQMPTENGGPISAEIRRIAASAKTAAGLTEANGNPEAIF